MSARYEFRLHVPYAHVDRMGVVYYAHYFVYFEMARSAMFRDAGLPYGELEARGILLPVIEAHCEYRQPARYDDELRVVLHNFELRGAVFRIEYEVNRGEERVAVGNTHHVCMSPRGKVLKPVPELRRFMRRSDGPTKA
jgi:acyl-CoA thioester hydrolase